jgi:hypothetical protein
MQATEKPCRVLRIADLADTLSMSRESIEQLASAPLADLRACKEWDGVDFDPAGIPISCSTAYWRALDNRHSPLAIACLVQVLHRLGAIRRVLDAIENVACAEGV